MAKRELITREEAIKTVSRWIKADMTLGSSLFEMMMNEIPTITEQEIVKPFLEKLKEQIAKSADKQLKIAMGTADLNERYAHIRVESAFRQCIAMIDNLLSEQETWI